MAWLTISRHTMFLPLIAAGVVAIATRQSMSFGYISPQSQVCIPPIDVPSTTFRCLLEHLMLSPHLILVAVMRKMGSQPVRWFAGISSADNVGDHKKIAAKVERLPAP